MAIASAFWYTWVGEHRFAAVHEEMWKCHMPNPLHRSYSSCVAVVLCVLPFQKRCIKGDRWESRDSLSRSNKKCHPISLDPRISSSELALLTGLAPIWHDFTSATYAEFPAYMWREVTYMWLAFSVCSWQVVVALSTTNYIIWGYFRSFLLCFKVAFDLVVEGCDKEPAIF